MTLQIRNSLKPNHFKTEAELTTINVELLKGNYRSKSFDVHMLNVMGKDSEITSTLRLISKHT